MRKGWADWRVGRRHSSDPCLPWPQTQTLGALAALLKQGLVPSWQGRFGNKPAGPGDKVIPVRVDWKGPQGDGVVRRINARGLRLAGLPLAALVASSLLLMACQRDPSPESQRLDQLQLRVDQLEKRLNLSHASDPGDRDGKPPAGVVKSLTFRMGSQDDRLRIYWADGSTSDLPCTKEQGTWACG